MDNAPQIGVDRWHQRFMQQARWTAAIRKHLIRTLNLQDAEKVLEIGCGTGAVTSELGSLISGSTFGLDINLDFVRKAQQNHACVRYLCGDAYHLPFADRSLDACFCHFLLLWLNAPAAALHEMRRIMKQNGYIVLLAEPDYAGRIDYPVELARIGSLQAESLKNQGANPEIGRSLASLLVEAGFRQVHCGLLGGEWGTSPSADQIASEWEMIHADLKTMLPVEELGRLQQIDQRAWEQAYRILFVPTFYAWGIL